MSTNKEFMDFILDQIIYHSGMIRYKKMFGEYALYYGDKIVALVCDNQVFVKPTISGEKYIGTITEGFAFSGAKMSFLIDERIEDSEWFSELILITAKELPEPKPKKILGINL